MTSLGRWIIFLVIVVAIGGFGWWFWSLGNVSSAAQDTPKFQLFAQSALVEVKSAGSSEWKQVAPNGKLLEVRQGDQIRTGQNGKAEIHWAERGVTRIEPDTELTVESIPDEEHYMTNASIQLRVTSGRVWTRVLKLLDLDSQVTVKTNDVVATVRGTAFGIIASAEGTDILVTESSVAVTPTGKTASLVSQNEAALYRKTTSTGAVTPRKHVLTQNDTWAEGHKKQDKEYDLWLKTQMRARLDKYRSAKLSRLSERLHDKVGKSQNEARIEIMMHRMMVESRHAPDRIKAVQEMLATLPPKARQRALANIEALLFINEDAPTEWRTQMEGLRRKMIHPDRLIERRVEDIPLLDTLLEERATSTPPHRPTSTEPLPILKQPIIDSVTKTPSAVTQPQTTLTAPPSTATTTAPVIKLSLTASPSVGVPDQAITLTVYKTVDGKRADVTSSANITFRPTNATLQGRTFTPQDIGTYTVTATISDPVAGRLVASLDVKVGPAIDIGPALDSTILVQ
ncbi:FecR domain-containing protein [Candidatus Uhrbacteria bacterium]|nr:FecR domain-containing protein [Candidatus Uhrbacteria bacterium]